MGRGSRKVAESSSGRVVLGVEWVGGEPHVLGNIAREKNRASFRAQGFCVAHLASPKPYFQRSRKRSIAETMCLSEFFQAGYVV